MHSEPCRDVSTQSEKWQHECEVKFSPEMQLIKRNQAPDGVKDELRGIRQIRGDAAVARLRAEIDATRRWYLQGTETKKAPPRRRMTAPSQGGNAPRGRP